MAGSVTGMGVYSGLTVETTLDPAAQPFLHDHQIESVTVLPGVMGAEAFAEVARLAAPDLHVAGVERMDFLAPLKFYRDEPRTVTPARVIRPDGDDLVADCALVGQPATQGRRRTAVDDALHRQRPAHRAGSAGPRPMTPPSLKAPSRSATRTSTACSRTAPPTRCSTGHGAATATLSACSPRTLPPTTCRPAIRLRPSRDWSSCASRRSACGISVRPASWRCPATPT